MTAKLTLILGGVRSGKSTTAENLAHGGHRVLFVATAEPLDEEMRNRIGAHQKNRPSTWDTLEEPLDPVAVVRPQLGCYDTFLLDCVTLWVSNLLLKNEHCPDYERIILSAVEQLLDLIEVSDANWVLVSNEVGLGVVPPSHLGRAFRDALGRANHLIASRADRVWLIVAGFPLQLKPPSP